MRICLVHSDLHSVTRGGICTLYRSLAPRLRDAGHDVTLLTLDTPHPVDIPGVTVHTLPRTDSLDAHRRAADQALAGLRPHVVECSTWEAEALHYLRRPRPDRAAVVVRGEVSAATMGATSLAAAERELVRGADAVLAVSDFAAADLTRAYDALDMVVVPNGVDRTRFHPGLGSAPASGFRVTSTGTVRSPPAHRWSSSPPRTGCRHRGRRLTASPGWCGSARSPR